MNDLRYQHCTLCPRRCGINRICYDAAEHCGYCAESAALRIACASIHRGEEPPITGAGGPAGQGGGSGTIFVSGCNLGCVFCQNHQISGRGAGHPLGKVVDPNEFAAICLALQKAGAENINIVTGSHAVPALVGGIAAAKERGLAIPVLWNSSAYELPETLELLSGTVDVFLPDMKTLDPAVSARYFNAPDYPAAAAAAIEKMISMRPLRFEKNLLVSGVMVRHLVLPGHLDASREVLRWFAGRCAGRALLSLMFQYTAVKRGVCLDSASMPNLNMEFAGQTPHIETAVIHDGQATSMPDRYITQTEYEAALGWLEEFGIEDGYCQELVPGNTDWLPDFEKQNPFPSDLSLPIWHWKNGFIV